MSRGIQSWSVFVYLAIILAGTAHARIPLPCPSGAEIGDVAQRTITGPLLHTLTGCNAATTAIELFFTQDNQQVLVSSSTIEKVNITGAVHSHLAVNVTDSTFEQVEILRSDLTDFKLRIEGGSCTLQRGTTKVGYAAIDLEETNLYGSEIVMDNVAMTVPTTLGSWVSLVTLDRTEIRQGTLLRFVDVDLTIAGTSVDRASFLNARLSLFESSRFETVDCHLDASSSKVTTSDVYVASIYLYDTPANHSVFLWSGGSIKLSQGGIVLAKIRTYLMRLSMTDRAVTKWFNTTVIYENLPVSMHAGASTASVCNWRGATFKQSLFLYRNVSLDIETARQSSTYIEAFQVSSSSNLEEISVRLEQSSVTLKKASSLYMMRAYAAYTKSVTFDFVDTTVTVLDSIASWNILFAVWRSSNPVFDLIEVHFLRSVVSFDSAPFTAIVEIKCTVHALVVSFTDSHVRYRYGGTSSGPLFRFISWATDNVPVERIGLHLTNTTYDIESDWFMWFTNFAPRGTASNVNITVVECNGNTTGTSYIFQPVSTAEKTGKPFANISIAVIGGHHRWFGQYVSAIYNDDGGDFENTTVLFDGTTIETSSNLKSSYLMGVLQKVSATDVTVTVRNSNITGDIDKQQRMDLALIYSAHVVDSRFEIISSHMLLTGKLVLVAGSKGSFNSSTIAVEDSTVAARELRAPSFLDVTGLVELSTPGKQNNIRFVNSSFHVDSGSSTVFFFNGIAAKNQDSLVVAVTECTIRIVDMIVPKFLELEKLNEAGVIFRSNDLVAYDVSTLQLVNLDQTVASLTMDIAANTFFMNDTSNFELVETDQIQDSRITVSNNYIPVMDTTRVTHFQFQRPTTITSNVTVEVRNNSGLGYRLVAILGGEFKDFIFTATNNTLRGETKSIHPQLVSMSSTTLVNSTIDITASAASLKSNESYCNLIFINDGSTINGSSIRLADSSGPIECIAGESKDSALLEVSESVVVRSTLEVSSTTVRLVGAPMALYFHTNATIEASSILVRNVSLVGDHGTMPEFASYFIRTDDHSVINGSTLSLEASSVTLTSAPVNGTSLFTSFASDAAMHHSSLTFTDVTALVSGGTSLLLYAEPGFEVRNSSMDLSSIVASIAADGNGSGCRAISIAGDSDSNITLEDSSITLSSTGPAPTNFLFVGGMSADVGPVTCRNSTIGITGTSTDYLVTGFFVGSVTFEDSTIDIDSGGNVGLFMLLNLVRPNAQLSVRRTALAISADGGDVSGIISRNRLAGPSLLLELLDTVIRITTADSITLVSLGMWEGTLRMHNLTLDGSTSGYLDMMTETNGADAATGDRTFEIDRVSVKCDVAKQSALLYMQSPQMVLNVSSSSFRLTTAKAAAANIYFVLLTGSDSRLTMVNTSVNIDTPGGLAIALFPQPLQPGLPIAMNVASSHFTMNADSCVVAAPTIESNGGALAITVSEATSISQRCGSARLVWATRTSDTSSRNGTADITFDGVSITTEATDTPEPLIDWTGNATVTLRNTTIVDNAATPELATALVGLRNTTEMLELGGAGPSRGRIALENVTLTDLARVMLPLDLSSAPAVPADRWPRIELSCATFDQRRVTRDYFPGYPEPAVAYAPLTILEQQQVCPVSITQSPSVSNSKTKTVPPTFTAPLTPSKSTSSTLLTTITATDGSVSSPLSASISVSGSTSQSGSDSVSRTRSVIKPVPHCGPARLAAFHTDEDIGDGFRSRVPPNTTAPVPQLPLATIRAAGVWFFLAVEGSINASFTNTAVDNIHFGCTNGEGEGGDQVPDANHCADVLAAPKPTYRPYSGTALAVYLPPWGDAVDFEGSVTLSLTVGEQAFACTGIPRSGLKATIVVTAPIPSDVRFAAAMATATAAVSVTGAVASPAALFDAQTLAIFSLISCSGDSARYSMKSASVLLSPFAIGPAPEGFLTTNLILLVALLAIFGLLVLYRVRRYPDRGLNHAMYVMRFPSLYFTLAMMLYQGTAVLAMRLIFDGRWSVQAALGALFGLVFPGLVHCIFYPRTKPRFQPGPRDLTFYRYDKDELTAAWPNWELARWWAHRALPVGRWNPATTRRQFGGPVQDVLSTWVLYASLPLVQAFIVAIVASVKASTRVSCIAQYCALTVFFLFFAGCVAFLRPYRTGLFNAFSTAGYLMLAIIVGTTGLGIAMPEWTITRKLAPVLLFTQFILSTVRTLYVVYIRVFERLFWRPFATKCVWNAMRDGDNELSEMFQLALPMHRDAVEMSSTMKEDVSVSGEKQGNRKKAKKKVAAEGWTVADIMQDVATL